MTDLDVAGGPPELGPPAEPAPAEPNEPAEKRDTRYAGVIDFVADYLAPMIRRRRGGGRVWCDRWWLHAEALDRTTALWHAWETLRLEGGCALSQWWINHFDPTWAALTDAEHGPFQACKKGHTADLRPLGHRPPDQGWLAGYAEALRLERAQHPHWRRTRPEGGT